MNVLFISNDPSILDRSSATYARMQSYAKAIGTVHILTRGPRDASEADGPLTVHSIRAGKLLGMRALVRRARALIGSEGIEVVSAQDPFEYGYAAMQAVRGTPAKLQVQVHTDFLSPWFVRGGIFRSPRIPMPGKNRVRRALADRVLPKADGIRVVSERVKQSLMARYGSTIPEPAVIPVAVGAQVPPKAPLPPHPFTFALITVGRLEPEKRIEDIIAALALVHERAPAAGLVIAGAGREEARLRRMAKEKGLADRVLFLGARDNAWGLMQSAQAYIQASAYEGYGRTLIEAALARIPIITTDVGVVGEVFSGFEDVLATPPGDPVNLSYHIIALMEDVQARELLIRNAEAKARAHLARYADLPQLIAGDLARVLAKP